MAADRFLKNQQRQALTSRWMGPVTYIYGLEVAGEQPYYALDMSFDDPVVLREGEELLLKQHKWRLTLYRMR